MKVQAMGSEQRGLHRVPQS